MFAGGPVFALLFISLGAAGYREYLELATRINAESLGSSAVIGYAAIVGLGFVAILDPTTEMLFAVTALAVTAPLVLMIMRPMRKGAITEWTLASCGSLYLGFPVYAAIATRFSPGAIGAPWLTDLASLLSLGQHAAPRGLAWALIVILTTWVGDSVAYLTGRAWGRTKLAQSISPNKTIEGAAGGLAGSVIVGAVAFQSFGLGDWWIGAVVGGAIGLAGQLGDLAESFLKRQAGVKDSGAVIPGHGGILDRIDGLLFAFPVGVLIAAGMDRMAS